MDLESAAAVLGVHYQTAYRWVRTGLLPAVKVGAGYELDPDHVATIAHERRQDRVMPARPGLDCAVECGALAHALASGDDVAARRLVEALQRDGTRPTAICDLVIAPALGRLHADWVAGSALPGEVAVAAEICERLVGLLASPCRGRPRGLAIVASPEDERHRLPGLMATVALRADRWRVHHLGCGLPAVDLADFVVAEQPDLLVLSVAAPAPGLDTIRELIAGPVPVLVGAPGASLAQLVAEAQMATTTGRRRARAYSPQDPSPAAVTPTR
jgi:MerR family transcriptional regulator, light-induced transcriptional regulator